MIESIDKALLEKIMKEAGKLLLSYWATGVGEMPKESGYYTKADIETEQLLKEKLFQLQAADFWAEESGQTGEHNNGLHWVIDPLDGTTNFAHHVPYFCISVALTNHGQPMLAAIYNPFLDEYFYAEKGKGATLNGKKIEISQPDKFSKAIIGVGLSYKHAERGVVINMAERVSRYARAVRHYGAVALDLANMACGRIDGVIFSNLYWWDVAAGALIVEEAGGIITQFDGSAISPDFKSCIAGSPLVHDNLKELAGNTSEG